MTNLNRIDILNSLLIWITLLVSFQFPFELFLFSYAVLGPLHYMTEINWLEKKNYFLNHQKDKTTYLFIALGVLILMTVGFLLKEKNVFDFTKSGFTQINSSGNLAENQFTLWTSSALFIALFMAVIYFLTDKWRNRLLMLCLGIVITFLFFNYPVFSIWFGLFLPTILHVFFFTIFFMWNGAVRSNSIFGYLNVCFMALVILIIVLVDVHPVTGSVASTTFNTFVSSNFQKLNIAINNMLGLIKNKPLDIYSSGIWKIQIFISFAYTYHYLNWFSKTTVINWHKTERSKLILITSLWLISLTLYYINYHFGLVALYVLSMLHVILEFPLNVGSMLSLLKYYSSKFKNKSVSVLPGVSN